MHFKGLYKNRVKLQTFCDIEKVFHLGVSDEEEKRFKVNLGSMLQIIEHKPAKNIDDDEDEGEDTNILPDDSVVVGIDN